VSALTTNGLSPRGATRQKGNPLEAGIRIGVFDIQVIGTSFFRWSSVPREAPRRGHRNNSLRKWKDLLDSVLQISDVLIAEEIEREKRWDSATFTDTAYSEDRLQLLLL
jgi:hypothetical protein